MAKRNINVKNTKISLSFDPAPLSQNAEALDRGLHQVFANKFFNKVENKGFLKKWEILLGEYIAKEIKKTAHWKSLSNFSNVDTLASQFGLKPSEVGTRLSQILQQWSNEVEITAIFHGESKKFSQSYLEVKIGMLYANYEQVLTLQAASYRSEKDASKTNEKTGKTYEYKQRTKIPWLLWLIDPLNEKDPASNERYALVSLNQYYDMVNNAPDESLDETISDKEGKQRKKREAVDRELTPDKKVEQKEEDVFSEAEKERTSSTRKFLNEQKAQQAARIKAREDLQQRTSLRESIEENALETNLDKAVDKLAKEVKKSTGLGRFLKKNKED